MTPSPATLERRKDTNMTTVEQSITAIRKWQRHHLLRQYGENGHVLPENLELSQHIDRVLSAASPQSPGCDASK